MTRVMTRRDLLGRVSRVGSAGLLTRALPFGVGAAVLGWPREARAAVLLDPIPSPSAGDDFSHMQVGIQDENVHRGRRHLLGVAVCEWFP